ncbi:3-oxoacyl-[acyl-carrier-protein] synthase [Cymbomonas tetramitiformis]|uniref:3-oxoacyl-[acyl-carrier-protein] synthase n=1 Tax=Cymbomonas tetramitiformis TaxID=36881 RepID=A0AAE0CFD1_9CHLO|nr:3-oxoacyl-[acyl-carrier-protein] synthase [Cymbomonas tetramitiformis]
MKTKTLQILWHGKEPVYSLDFHASGVLATAGGDKEIKLWEVFLGENGVPAVKHLESLTAHNRVVNMVRFSPTGETLASAGDTGEILLWKPTGEILESCSAEEIRENCTWKYSAMLRGHNDDVQALDWAPDSLHLLSGSVDNTSIVWDACKGQPIVRLVEHKGYVQGVAWDPTGHFLVSQSGDRTCRVYAPLPVTAKGSKKKQPRPQQLQKITISPRNLACQHVLARHEIEVPQSAQPVEQGEAPSAEDASKSAEAPLEKGQTKLSVKYHLFHDDTLPSFFRRLAWSPDGTFLAVPAGLHKREVDSKTLNALFFYSRGNFTTPAACVSGLTSPAIAVRFCPIIFQLHEQSPVAESGTETTSARDVSAAFDLPYRIVMAVATVDSVFLVDTQHMYPFALVGGSHPTSLTDLAWSPDASKLVISSTDGYCSVVAFEAGELGTPAPIADLPPYVTNLMDPRRYEEAAAAAAAAAAKAKANLVKASAPQNKENDMKTGSEEQAPTRIQPECTNPAPAASPSAQPASTPREDERQPLASAPSNAATPQPSGADPELAPSSTLPTNHTPIKAALSTPDPPAKRGARTITAWAVQGKRVDEHASVRDEGALSTEKNEQEQAPSSKKKRITPVAVGSPGSREVDTSQKDTAEPQGMQLEGADQVAVESTMKKRRITPVSV